MLNVQTAGDSGRNEALQLLYSRLPARERDSQTASMLAAARRGEIALDDLLVARDGEEPVGALLLLRRPGCTAFLWPPVCRSAAGSRAAEIGAALLSSAAERADRAGIQFTQALLDPHDLEARRLLQLHGFPQQTTLSIQERSLEEADSTVSDRLTAIEYTADQHSRFANSLERTLEGTLDCPIVSRLRTGDEALAAHRTTGAFRPSGWRLYQDGSGDVAILLVADFPESETCELAYLGVVPEARGRGWGRILVRDAIEIGRRWQRARMQVAVDLENRPALEIYRSLGFQRQCDLAVHLRLRDGSRTSG